MSQVTPVYGKPSEQWTPFGVIFSIQKKRKINLTKLINIKKETWVTVCCEYHPFPSTNLGTARYCKPNEQYTFLV